MSETVDLLGFSADKSFLGLIKNSPKKKISTQQQFYSLLLSTLEPVQIAHSESLLLTFDCNKWLFEVLVSYLTILL